MSSTEIIDLDQAETEIIDLDQAEPEVIDLDQAETEIIDLDTDDVSIHYAPYGNPATLLSLDDHGLLWDNMENDAGQRPNTWAGLKELTSDDSHNGFHFETFSSVVVAGILKDTRRIVVAGLSDHTGVTGVRPQEPHGHELVFIATHIGRGDVQPDGFITFSRFSFSPLRELTNIHGTEGTIFQAQIQDLGLICFDKKWKRTVDDKAVRIKFRIRRALQQKYKATMTSDPSIWLVENDPLDMSGGW